MAYGEIVAEARRLNAIIGDTRWSKSTRNGAITLIRKLEAKTGLRLRKDTP